MITAIAIDDEPLGIQVVKEYCNKTDFLDLKATFTSAARALEYLKLNPIKLLFLDIEMPLVSGIDFCKMVPGGTMVIFTTAFSQYAVDSYNLNAIDYLLKPFDFGRFTLAVEKAKTFDHYQKIKNTGEAEYLFIKIDYSIKKIDLNDILYVESQDNYIKIHLDDGKSILVRMALKALLQQLPESRFIRVHRSFIIPKSKVTSYRNRMIYIGKLEIPTSGLYIDDVNRLFSSEI